MSVEIFTENELKYVAALITREQIGWMLRAPTQEGLLVEAAREVEEIIAEHNKELRADGLGVLADKVARAGGGPG